MEELLYWLRLNLEKSCRIVGLAKIKEGKSDLPIQILHFQICWRQSTSQLPKLTYFLVIYLVINRKLLLLLKAW